MWSMPFLLPLPVVDIAAKILYTLVWIILFTWCITAGEVAAPEADFDSTEIHGMVKTFTYTTEDKIRIGYYILALFWGLEMITAMTHFSISYTVACWYFTPCLPHSDFSKPRQDPSTL